MFNQSVNASFAVVVGHCVC